MKEKLRHIIDCISNSLAGPYLKSMYDSAMLGEYHLLCGYLYLIGKRRPSLSEQQLMRENVTIIYKSFERQKMAKRLFRNIQKYYPGIKVIIADDSKEPLKIDDANAEVVQLPFNSGLSQGIISALERVKTPYLIRLDDDELLTPCSKFEEQLHFLMEHPEIDIAAVLCFGAPFWRGAKWESRRYYAQSMRNAPLPLKIPHMTRIDKRHVVVGKVPNIFIARTEKIREVGYDKNIRMIDHNEFFYRAAGRLVSVLDEKAYIYHYHNPFDAHYNQFRNDYLGDLKYIQIKHSRRKKS